MAELPPRDTVESKQSVRTQSQHYTVKAGDTLASVATQHKLTPKFLARMNRMRSDTAGSTALEAGTVLTIPRVEFDPFGPVAGAWAESPWGDTGWVQGWSESWPESGPMWTQKGGFIEVGDQPIPNLPGGGFSKP